MQNMFCGHTALSEISLNKLISTHYFCTLSWTFHANSETYFLLLSIWLRSLDVRAGCPWLLVEWSSTISTILPAIYTFSTEISLSVLVAFLLKQAGLVSHMNLYQHLTGGCWEIPWMFWMHTHFSFPVITLMHQL